MARVLKYQLKSLTEQNVKTCTGKVLTVQLQSGKPMMWVLVEDEKKMVERTVYIIGTGCYFEPGDAKYVSTISEYTGFLIVLHVFVTDGKEVAPLAED